MRLEPHAALDRIDFDGPYAAKVCSTEILHKTEVDGVRVGAHERALLFREGELIDQLGPGLHVFWKDAGQVTWKPIDLREQVADIAGQEIMTADKVTLRVNLVATFQVTDPVKAV